MRYVRSFFELLQKPLSRRGLLRLCLIAGLLIGLFTHGFMFANKVPNMDDYRYGRDLADAGVGVGRFALYFFWKCFSNMSIPWLNGLWGVLFLSCAGFLICDAFGMRRVWQALGVMAVFVTYPGNVSIFTFMYEAHAFMLGIALAALTVWVIRYVRFGFLWAVVPLVLAVGTYQVFLMLAAVLMLLLIIRQTALVGEEGQTAALTGWRLAFACALTLALGTLCYIAAAKTIPVLMGTSLHGYQGVNNMGSLNVQALPQKLAMAYDTVCDFFYANMPHYNTHLSKLVQHLLLLAGLGAGLWHVVRAAVQRRFGHAALLLLCLVLLPVASAGVYFMGDDIIVHGLTFYAMVALLLTPMLIFPTLRMPKARRAAALSLALLCAAYGFAFNVIGNQAYYKMYLAYTRAQQFINRLAVRIESTEGYAPEMAVGLYGVEKGFLPDGLVYYEVDETSRFLDLFGVATETDQTSDVGLSCGLSIMVGLPVTLEWGWSPKTPEEKAQADAMPIYPAPGSLQMVGDVCVVKFGER